MTRPLAHPETVAGLAARAARYWRTETTVFLGMWLSLMLVGRSGFLGDPGSLWHIVVGQRMLASGELIHTDSFSFTSAGKPWTPQSWLAECVLALIHQVSGLDGILLATVTLLACLYTWVVHRLIRAGLHPLLAVLLMALTFLASTYHFHARPHLMTIALLGWTLAELNAFEAGRISLPRLFGLVPVFVLWANLHAGMLGGLGTLTITVAGWTILYWCGWGGPVVRARQILWLGLLVAACGLASFVNPYGAELPRVWLSLMGSPVLPRYVQEHQPLLNCGPWAISVVLLLGFIHVSALLGVLPVRPRVTWLVPLVWLGLTWTRIRHGPLFAITTVIVLADVFPRVRWARWLAGKGSVVFRLRTPESSAARRDLDWRPMLVPSAVVVTAVVLQLASCSVPLLGRGWARLDRSKWPLELLPELHELEGSADSETPIFNDMAFGGFLIYHTPRLRVFIDDRCELYGDEGVIDYVHALQDPAQIDQWADQYGFETALIRTDSPFDVYLQHASGWSMVRRTEAATLYRRSIKVALRDSESVPEGDARSLDRKER
jgi:hypothetical protein